VLTRGGRDGGNLPPSSFDLLEKLLRAAGRIITREELLERCAGPQHLAFRSQHRHAYQNLRKKLGHQAGLLDGSKQCVVLVTSTRKQAPPTQGMESTADAAGKKNVRLESALVRLARNQFTWGEMGRLRIVEW